MLIEFTEPCELLTVENLKENVIPVGIGDQIHVELAEDQHPFMFQNGEFVPDETMWNFVVGNTLIPAVLTDWFCFVED